MRKIIWVVLIAVLLMLPGQSFAQQGQVYFIYASTQYDRRDEAGAYREPLKAEIHWFPLDQPEAERLIEVAPFDLYRLSPDGSHLAFKGIRRDGNFYVLDLNDGKLTTLDYQQPTQEFLSDQYWIKSGSMVWSPDGQKLAFTASEGGNSSARGDVYVYDVQSGGVMKMTGNLTILQSLIVPSSWSPDGQWLVVYGAWSQTDGPTSLVPVFESGVISADGQTFLELANKANTCRLVWSPDMHWLASDTECFAGIGNPTSLMLIPFDPKPVTSDGRREDQFVSPLVLDWGFSSSWSYHYKTPIWKDAHTVIAYRGLEPIMFGNMPDELVKRYTVEGLISFDTQDYSQNALPITVFDSSTVQIGDWYADEPDEKGILAYNPVSNRLLELPKTIQSCPISFALQIEAQGDYVSVLDACSSEERRSQAKITVYETGAYREVFSATAEENEYLLPLGFGKL